MFSETSDPEKIEFGIHLRKNPTYFMSCRGPQESNREHERKARGFVETSASKLN
jgi:hypothetical protein